MAHILLFQGQLLLRAHFKVSVCPFLAAYLHTKSFSKLFLILEKTDNEFMKFGVLKCIRFLSKSRTLAKILSQESNLKTLLQLVDKNYQEDAIVFVTLDIFWNILESSPSMHRECAIEFLAKQQNLLVFKNAFENSTNVLRMIDKQRRNEFLLICNHLAGLFPPTVAVMRGMGLSQLVYNILTNGVLSSSKGKKDESKLVIFSPNIKPESLEDFELRRILSKNVILMLKDPASLQYFLSNCILEYGNVILGSATNAFVSNLNPYQLSALQVLVLEMYHEIIPAAPKEFRASNGPLHVVNFLGELLQNGDALDRKRADLIRSHNCLLNSCLLAMLRLSETGTLSNKLLGRLNVFKYLMKILGEPNQSVMVWRETMILCSKLCHKAETNKQMFGEAGGVEIVNSFLKWVKS